MGDATQVLLELTRSEAYVRAWQAIIENPLTFDEFSKLEMPDGCTPEVLWHHFAILRRCSGVTFAVKPWFRASGDVSWTSITKSTERDLDQIALLAGPDSVLNERLKDMAIAVGLDTYIIDELLVACHRDGIRLSRETLHALWTQQRKPMTAEEQVVANLSAVMRNVNAYAKRPFSIALLERLHDDLIDEVGELEHLKSKRLFDASMKWEERTSDRSFVEKTVRDAIGRGACAGSVRDGLIAYYEMSNALWDLGYFPSLNALTELALRRVLFIRLDMPIMSYAPVAALQDKAAKSYAQTFADEFAYVSSIIGSEEGIDCTIMFSGAVSMFLKGLKTIEKRVGFLTEQIKKTEESLEEDTTLNRRQKDFLITLERNPDTMMKMKTYADLFGVVRATARADLFDLVAKGYLKQRMDDRTTVFFRG